MINFFSSEEKNKNRPLVSFSVFIFFIEFSSKLYLKIFILYESENAIKLPFEEIADEIIFESSLVFDKRKRRIHFSSFVLFISQSSNDSNFLCKIKKFSLDVFGFEIEIFGFCSNAEICRLIALKIFKFIFYVYLFIFIIFFLYFF
jgi:hypothetical protein